MVHQVPRCLVDRSLWSTRTCCHALPTDRPCDQVHVPARVILCSSCLQVSSHRAVCSSVSTTKLYYYYWALWVCLICSPSSLRSSLSIFQQCYVACPPMEFAFSKRLPQASGREQRSTLANTLSLDVRSSFAVGQKTKPYRTETAVFSPKPNRNRPTSAIVKP